MKDVYTCEVECIEVSLLNENFKNFEKTCLVKMEELCEKRCLSGLMCDIIWKKNCR